MFEILMLIGDNLTEDEFELFEISIHLDICDYDFILENLSIERCTHISNYLFINRIPLKENKIAVNLFVKLNQKVDAYCKKMGYYD